MRKRILLLVLSLTVVVILAFVIPLAILIRNQVYSDAVRSLQEKASRVGNYLHQSGVDVSNTTLSAALAALGDCAASVQLPNGTVVGTAPPGTPPTATSPNGTGPPSGPGGDHGGGPAAPEVIDWYGGKLVQLSDSAGTVRVYATDSELRSGETGWWLLLGLGSFGLLLLGAGASEVLTRRLVRPLTDTAATAHRLSAGDITARAPTEGPREIAEVGRALNRLADRIDELIAEERETVADLSHRLRTPLTALRLEAESLSDPADAERIGDHASVLERMLTAVIHAARRPQREGRMPAADATEVVGERVRFWSALAEDQARTFTVELPESPVPVRASAEDLATAVDALLENVIAHTPEGTAFAVALAATSDGARLVVRDEGPGLPDTAPARGRSDRGSSGLGLDIARRCAEAAGGGMELGSAPGGGAAITLTFSAP